MQQHINRITDILRRDDGISGAMHYTEQISWILFLKFLDDYESSQADAADLDGREYTYIIESQYRWSEWIARDNRHFSGDDFKEFINKELFPYFKRFRNVDGDYHSIKYKIGEIFYFLDNRIESGHTIREVVNIIDGMNFQKQEDLFELSKIYEDLLQGMGNDGGNSGEFYTPRAIIKLIVDIVDPKVGDTIYDPASGSCGFLIEAFHHIRPQITTDKELSFLSHSTFFGNEKTPLAYILGVMNMILHGVHNPNISKTNTLTTNIRDIQEKDRYDIILANPPFGGKEKEQIQQNFIFPTTATEMLFLQHIAKMLKTSGRTGIVVPEGVLFNTSEAFKNIKKEILENYNLHTIISLPAGVFLPYSGVKTNIIFFDRVGVTRDIWYHEINLGRKLTKNKPISYAEIKEVVELQKNRSITENSWIVPVGSIKDYDISAKNPNTANKIVVEAPDSILARVGERGNHLEKLYGELLGMIR
ncbi:MAG: class I SAM-dependent DNA methyltransferase [Candidatus Gracilibacteria bacterium]|nr:class I SAM-dependent DNA methyltransferase [Candidatus Gracilibacteria bacterium]